MFQRLLGASGFGPKLALALLSTLGPERTVRSIRREDLAALSVGQRHRQEEGGATGARAAGPVRAELIRIGRRRPARPAPTSGAGAGGAWATRPAAADEAVRAALADGDAERRHRHS